MRGIVEFFDEQRGFGKIRPEDNSALCFVHFSAVNDTTEQVLVQGEEVEFEPHTGTQGLQAKNVVRTDTRYRGQVATYNQGWGFVAPSDGEPQIFVHQSDIVAQGYRRLEVGEEVSYAIGDGPKGTKAIRVRRLDTRLPFERFAACPNIENQLVNLAELAQRENWNYRLTESRRQFPILKSFIFYTFTRLEAEGKIATASTEAEGDVACFNTGLATERQEAIFAFFKESRRLGPKASRWVLDQFAKESDRVLTFFAQRPDIANYFSDPTELLYDTRVELVVDVESRYW